MYSLVQLGDSKINDCAQFIEDNNSRLKVKNTNNCLTVKNTQNMTNLILPNPSKESEEIDYEILGLSRCADTIDKDQTFVWL